MRPILILLLVSICFCQYLVNKEGAEQIKSAGATWEVVDPEKSVFKNVSRDEFASGLQTDWLDGPELPQLGEGETESISEDSKGRKLQGIPGRPGTPRRQVMPGRPGNQGNQLVPGRPGGMQGRPGRMQGLNLPESFDGRKEWGKCIHSGKNQGKCSGCWAFGIANLLSDRFCINGQDILLSVQDLLECTPGNKCCNGGNAKNAYDYIMNTGLIEEDCKPFDSKCNECRPSKCKRYKCVKNSAWVTTDTTRAKWEIMENGPITAIYDVYDDFAYYDGGVYYRTTDKKIGIHSVTLVGWGKENGMEYWICKNSWGDYWGEQGFFKIKIGDSGINNYMTGCLPLIEPQ